METPQFQERTLKQAFDISFAAFKVSTRFGNRAFSEHLQSQALSLLESAVAGDYEKVRISAKTLEYVVRLMTEVDLISKKNGDILITEINILDSAIAEHHNSAKLPDVDLQAFFNAKDIDSAMELPNQQLPNVEFGNPAKASTPSGNPARQELILGKIREKGECRLKDIQDLLPGASERTLRYDLQALVEQGALEKIGQSGPSTFYRVKGGARV